jgi:lactate permease
MLTVDTGEFDKVKASVVALSPDRRLQALLIAFCFGAFIEGAAGFGTPVAISGALLIGAGFPPLYAAGLTLIANTAPVAFGALGTPIATLAKVTNLPEAQLSAMAGRQLPLFALIIPAWMVVTMSGWRGLRGVWPAVLVCGGAFAAVQFFVSNYVGPSLADVAGGLTSLAVLAIMLRFWHPRELWEFDGAMTDARPQPDSQIEAAHQHQRSDIIRAWVPWILLSLCVFVWGLPKFRAELDRYTQWTVSVPFLDRQVQPDASILGGDGQPKAAEFRFNWASATGTGIMVAAILSALWMRTSPRSFARLFLHTVYRLRWPLFTIAAMLAIAYTTQYSGTDVTLGLAFTHTGKLYPFFAPLLGWLGVALTGSDTSSNALFGNLQRVTAERLGLSPILICASNSTGGVMGKMIDAQSIVVATSATDQSGQEGRILRFVFWHSIALAALVGLVTLVQAYWLPDMIPSP